MLRIISYFVVLIILAIIPTNLDIDYSYYFFAKYFATNSLGQIDNAEGFEESCSRDLYSQNLCTQGFFARKEILYQRIYALQKEVLRLKQSIGLDDNLKGVNGILLSKIDDFLYKRALVMVRAGQESNIQKGNFVIASCLKPCLQSETQNSTTGEDIIEERATRIDFANQSIAVWGVVSEISGNILKVDSIYSNKTSIPVINLTNNEKYIIRGIKSLDLVEVLYAKNNNASIGDVLVLDSAPEVLVANIIYVKDNRILARPISIINKAKYVKILAPPKQTSK